MSLVRKNLFIFSFVLFGLLPIVHAIPGVPSAVSLSGEWKFIEMIYKGQRMARPNPELNLRWTFFANGTERLYWDRENIPGFCERFSTFKVENNYLKEDVFAINPNNNSDCSKDPDMQLGPKGATFIEKVADEIWLHLQMGDEDLIYVLKEIK